MFRKIKNQQRTLFFVALTALVWVCNAQWATAQDVITLKDDTKIKCTIVEVSEEQVKYKPWAAATDRVIVIERTLVRKIKYEGGDPDVLDREAIEANYFLDDRRHNIKFSFLAPSANGYTFTYERAISPAASWEASLRIQGGGIQSLQNETGEEFERGVGFGVGYKVSFNSSTRKATKSNHILHGAYLRPELFVNFTSKPYGFFNGINTVSDRYRSSSAGVMANIGKQWIFNNRFSIDAFIGGGYVFELSNTFDEARFGDNVNFSRTTISGGEIVGITDGVGLQWGLRIGYVFDMPKKDKKK